MTSREITNILANRRWHTRRHIIVPNVTTIAPWEMDLAVMQASGWLEEVEIKISMSDFRKEFTSKRWKHGCLRGEAGYRHRQVCVVKKYWIAAPPDLAAKILPLLPPYAGLLSVSDGSRKDWLRPGATVLKEAPTLPKSRKLTEKEQQALLRLAYLRYWNLRNLHKEEAA